MNVQKCLECDPYEVDAAHWDERLSIFLEHLGIPSKTFERALARFPRFNARFTKLITYGLLHFLLRVRAVRETPIAENDPRVYNRSQVFVREAAREGIHVLFLTFFGQPTNFFSMATRHGNPYLFEGLPHLPVGVTLPIDIDDKQVCKELARAQRVPVASGAVCRSLAAARGVARRLGFPLVVKPAHGSLSKHTTCNILNDSELQAAVRSAQCVARAFLVERHIAGAVFRMTVVDGTLAAACRREPPTVIGDGAHTIAELCEKKNCEPLRGPHGSKAHTLHHVPITPVSKAFLAKQGITLDTVPAVGARILLHPKVILACGADIHDVTDMVHRDTKAMMESLARACKIPVVGFDIIMRDITRSYQEQECALLEANSLPYIDMHHYPVSGEPRNVAKEILRWFLRTQSVL